MPPSLPPDVARALRDIVGAANFLTDADLTATYAVDWTGRFRGATPAVVRPGNTAEIAAVVSVCAAEAVALVPQGGRTGLVGGSVPLAGEVVISTHRLSTVEPVDDTAGQLTAEAGAPVASVQHAAFAAGWMYGIDFAARDSASIGGTIATNAGGLHLLRYGGTRHQLLGVEAVLGDGSVVSHLGGLMKDNTGYDLAGLLCGSEGTLGIVTRARLRLHPPAPARVVAMVGFTSVALALVAAGALRRSLPSLEACELVLAPGLELVARVSGHRPPFEAIPPAALVVGCAGLLDSTDELAAAVDALDGVVDVAVAEERARRAELWHWREGHTEAIGTLGAPHKLDVTLPAATLVEFLERVTGAVTAVAGTAQVWLFGHAADGNVHVNVTGVEPDDERVDDAVLRLVAGLGGSISAEHGIGTAKRRWLTLNRSPEELAAFRAIKSALDPAGILNPNVLLP
ncbi:MAG TPA: FAD-binding oxidoreductase [Acidimicrobiales bacterium]|nr:FAD-binding oxidoreductase [Acidimicrobiales bacterium]